MCVIAFAWNVHPRWRLLLIGNRDEFHARPSAPLARWDNAPHVLAGRDLQAGGTWMGVSERGRACVVTNVRDPRAEKSRLSRGLLAADYLRGDDGAAAHALTLARTASRYRPFNLLLFDRDEARFVSDCPQTREETIASGVHGLSNADLDAPWPKTLHATAALRTWIDVGGEADFSPLFAALADQAPAPDAELPDTGVGIQLERRLSPAFVCGVDYGTRATTLIAFAHDGAGCIVERRFGRDGAHVGENRIDFRFD